MWWLLASLVAASGFAISASFFYDAGLDLQPVWVDIGFWSIIGAGLLSRVMQLLLHTKRSRPVESDAAPSALSSSQRTQG